jgi:hypothetical protein
MQYFGTMFFAKFKNAVRWTNVCSILGLLTVAQVSLIAGPITPDSPGWTLVRHADTVGGWHPIDDNLAGTAVYGTFGTETSAGDFSINFETAVSGWNQILFMFGDRSKWMVMDRSQLSIEVADDPLQILASYLNANPYLANMYNRPGLGEDPWFSAVDHHDAIYSGDILYGEASFGHAHFYSGAAISMGANVFIRNASSASVPDGASTMVLVGVAFALIVGSRRKVRV